MTVLNMKSTAVALALVAIGAGASAAPTKHPDLGGIWDTTAAFDPAKPPPRAAPPPYNAEYQKKYAANQALIKAGKLDLGALCTPPGMPQIAHSIGQFEILNTPGRMTFIHEYQSQVRRIFFTKRPADVQPTMNGDSRAHWEGGTLVIDTVALKPFSYIDSNAGPHSEDTHVVERIQLLHKDLMEIDTTVDDAQAFTKPWHYVNTFKRVPNGLLIDDECNENPRNPINPDGTVGFTFQGTDGK